MEPLGQRGFSLSFPSDLVIGRFSSPDIPLAKWFMERVFGLLRASPSSGIRTLEKQLTKRANSAYFAC